MALHTGESTEPQILAPFDIPLTGYAKEGEAERNSIPLHKFYVLLYMYIIQWNWLLYR